MKSIALALAMVLPGCGADAPTVDFAPVETAVEAAVEAAKSPALALTGRLVDRASLFDDARARALVQRLERLEQATTDQVVVVSLPSLGSQKIDELAQSLGTRWKIGRADVDNGVVMLVAPTERRIWISVGTGLEGLLTNQRTQGIVDRMLPDFKRGDLPGGIERGVGEIEQVLQSDRRRPQRLPEPTRKAA